MDAFSQREASPCSFMQQSNYKASQYNHVPRISQQLKLNAQINIRNLQLVKKAKSRSYLDELVSPQFPSSINYNQHESQDYPSKVIQFAIVIKQLVKELPKKQAYKYFHRFILIVFIVSCILQTINSERICLTVGKYIQLCIQIYFSILIIIKAFLWRPLSIGLLVIEIIVHLVSYIGLAIDQTESQVYRHLKAFRTIKLLLIIFQFQMTEKPFNKFLNALKKAGKILIPAFMFITFYAIVGLYLFKDLQYNKCRDPSNKALTSSWTVYSDQIFLCGQRQCPIINNVQYQCLNPIDYGVQPNPSQLMNIVQGSSLMQYGNIFYSILSTTKQIFITGSSRLMILNKQAMNPFFVLVYYLSFLYLVSYIYLNIFYGLMTINEQNQQSQTPETNDLKVRGQLQDSLNKEQTKNGIRQKDLKVLINNKPYLLQNQQNSPKLKFNQNKIAHINQKNQNIQFHSNQVKNNKPFQKQNNHILFVQEQNSKSSQESSQISIICLQNSNSKQKQKGHDNFIQCYQEPMRIVSSDHLQNSDLLNLQTWNKRLCMYKHIVVPLCALNLAIVIQNPSQALILIVSAMDLMFYNLLIIELFLQIYLYKKMKQTVQIEVYMDLLITLFCTIGVIYQVAITSSIYQFLTSVNIPYYSLRAVKYLRILTLLSQTLLLKQAKTIFRIIIQTIYKMRYVTFLWFYVLLGTSLVGYHLFSSKTIVNSNNQLDFTDGKSYQINFDSLPYSLSFTALVFFNEEWDYFMFQQYIGAGFQVVIWVYFLVIFGLTFFSKYFMALTIKVVGQRLDEEPNFTFQQDEQLKQNQIEIKQQFDNSQISKHQNFVETKQKKYSFRKSYESNDRQNSQISGYRNSVQMPRFSEGKLDQILCNFKNNINANLLEKMFAKRSINKNIQVLKNQINGINTNNCLNTSSKKSQDQTLFQKFQVYIQKILLSSTMAYLTVFMTFLSCGSYIFFDQIQGYKYQIGGNMAFTIIYYKAFAFFTFLMICNMIVYGFFGQNSYFKRNWMSSVNFCIVLIEFLSFMEQCRNSQIFTSFLTMRIFRIMYIIQFRYRNNKNMRLTIVSFMKLIPKILKLLMITISIYGFFAILFANMYRNKFSSCSNYESSATIVTQSDCYSWGGDWTNQQMNADNFLSALLYLFLMATTQGWSTLMIKISTLVGISQQPSQNNNFLIYAACQCFFFLGNMFLLNLFIGLTIYNFNKIKQQVTGQAKLNQDQKMWLNIKSQIYRLKPQPLPTPFQNDYSTICFNFLKSQKYNVLNIIFSLFFILTMSMFTTNQSQNTQKILLVCLIIYCGVHLIDYMIHWISFGIRVSFWGNFKFYFDTFTVIFTIIFAVLLFYLQFEKMSKKIAIGTIIALHMMKAISIINQIKFVNKMTSSLISVLPQTINMLFIILVILFIYTVIGMELFAYLKYGTQLNEFDQNYTSFSLALYSLIKFSTMESPIFQISNAANHIQPNFVCFQINSYEDYLLYGHNGCGSQVKSYLFFLSFHVIYSLILISALMAIIFDAYSQVVKEEEALINKFQLQQVKIEWSQYDPEAKGFISYRDFWLFTAKLIKIYNFQKDTSMMSNATKQQFLTQLNIQIYEDQGGVLSFQFHQVVQALTRIYLKQKFNNSFSTVQADKLFEEFQLNALQCSIKKSSYHSSQVLSLILLKSGLKVWKRKAMQKGQDNVTFQDRIKKGHMFIANLMKNPLNQNSSNNQDNEINTDKIKEIDQVQKTQKQQKCTKIQQKQEQSENTPKISERRLSLRKRRQVKKSRFRNIDPINSKFQEQE